MKSQLALWCFALCPLVLIALFEGCTPAAQDEWAQWRGRGGLGIAPEGPLPTVWGLESSNLRWKTPIPGIGNSSPAVQSGRIYLTTAYGNLPDTAQKNWRAVVALDLASGELLWERELFERPPEKKHRLNTLAAPTPAADTSGVYVYFGSHLAKLDPEGEVLWMHEIDPAYAEYSRYGASTSPVLTDDAVVVVQDRESAGTEDKGWLAAFDKTTGERVWRQEWSDSCCSYSTPLVTHRAGKPEIVFAHSGMVGSYDASTGERLWTYPYKINQMVSSPVIWGDILAISGGAHNIKRTVVLRLSGTGTETATELLWDSPRFVPQTSSPVLYQGRFYTLTDQGIMTCYDVESGELLWKSRLPNSKNRASLIAGDGKIYAQSTSSNTTVIEAGTEYKLLADNDLGDPGSNASPAVAGGCFLIRTKHYLVCIDAPSGRT